MASRRETVDYLIEQMGGPPDVTARKMFGDYGLYRDGRMVALVCDDRLYMKPTPGGRAHAGPVEEAPPYPGAKPCLLIPGERWEDGDWLAQLARVSAAELPAPTGKKRAAVAISERKAR